MFPHSLKNDVLRPTLQKRRFVYSNPWGTLKAWLTCISLVVGRLCPKSQRKPRSWSFRLKWRQLTLMLLSSGMEVYPNLSWSRLMRQKKLKSSLNVKELKSHQPKNQQIAKSCQAPWQFNKKGWKWGNLCNGGRSTQTRSIKWFIINTSTRQALGLNLTSMGRPRTCVIQH